jgi:hypothetical protein
VKIADFGLARILGYDPDKREAQARQPNLEGLYQETAPARNLLLTASSSKPALVPPTPTPHAAPQLHGVGFRNTGGRSNEAEPQGRLNRNNRTSGPKGVTDRWR